ncbi:MAG TPA: ribosome-associated translation inhibitor RaiA [Firmicutes bacterium]|jgi:putative sigma-54 modulation protein|nr:ribosome-associated translation inhibitor RaiA [Bacillota bacterium]
MHFITRGKNMEITPALQEYVEKRLSKLDKYLGTDDTNIKAQVTMSVAKGNHIVEVTISIGGLLLRGEEETQDMYASIDLVVDKIERQIHKYKTKINRKLRQKGLKELNEQFVSSKRKEEEETEPRIVRTKRFIMKPMPEEEAILQMNLLGHDFFVFTNAETEEINVIYKRKDGNYGLIEPEE